MGIFWVPVVWHQVSPLSLGFLNYKMQRLGPVLQQSFPPCCSPAPVSDAEQGVI